MNIVRISSPKSEILKDKIEFFYQYCYDGNDEYYTYPNNHCFWTIALNTKKTFEKNRVILKEDQSAGFHQAIIGPISNRIKVQYTGNIQVISVCFKPAFIHSFLDFKLDLDADKILFTLPLEFYIPPKIVSKEFSNSDSSSFLFLESFFERKLNSFDKSKLYKAINLIESDPEIKIEEVADELEISMKSLIYAFKKYVGRTPLSYKRVNKFRMALNSNRKNLSDVCYESSYFDHSHMIRDFKKFGLQTPRKLKDRPSISGKKEILWLKV